MAIDMIENNELAALAPSRLGLRQFADDEFANLFGSQKRKDSLARTRAEENAKWRKYPLKTCEDAQTLLNLTLAEAESLNKIIAASPKDVFPPERLKVVRAWEAEARRKLVGSDCEAKAAAAAKAEREKATLETLTQLGDTSVQKAQSELRGLQSDGTSSPLNTQNILIYGGLAIAGIVVISLILRR